MSHSWILDSARHHHICITAPINETMNDIARALANKISKRDHFRGRPIIIRVHATETERKIFLKTSNERRGKPAHAKSAVFDESDIDSELAELMPIRSLINIYRNANIAPFDMNDPRLCVYEMSPGNATLQVSGIIQSHLIHPDADR